MLKITSQQANDILESYKKGKSKEKCFVCETNNKYLELFYAFKHWFCWDCFEAGIHLYFKN